jgi:hypothetical protein
MRQPDRYPRAASAPADEAIKIGKPLEAITSIDLCTALAASAVGDASR